jgi:outer membrane receptor protein involved in Fe transport
VLAAAAALAALVARATPALAQEADFFAQKESYFRSETIEGVSKHAEALTETPATVTVISRDDIERYGFRTVADVLNFASLGSFAHSDRRYDFAGGRGLFFFEDFNTRILVMLDGHPLNEPWNNFGGVGREMLVPLDLVERIELVYGPSSLLYGGYSLYGIVNVITQTGTSAAGRRVRASGGSWRTGEGVASWGLSGVSGASAGKSGTPWSLLVAGGYYRSEGEPLDLPAREVDYSAQLGGGTEYGGPQSKTDAEKAPFGFLYAQRGDLTLVARSGFRQHGAALAPYGSIYGSTEEYVRDGKSFAELRWDKAVTPSFSVFARAFHDVYSYEEHDPYADAESYPGEDGYNFVLHTDDHDSGGELRLSYRKGAHYVLGGAEYRHRGMTQNVFNELFTGLPDETSRNSATVDGTYADTQPGGSKAQPRVALIYKPKANVSLKGIYARGFRPPSIFEAAYRDDVNQIDNPSLRSEEIASYELSTMWNLNPRVSLQAYGFHSTLHGLIQGVSLQSVDDVQGGVLPPSGDVADLIGILQYQSTGDVRSQGAGVAAHARVAGFDAYLNAAYARGRLLAAGEEAALPARSTRLGSAGVSYRKGLWTASVNGRYVGPQALEPGREEGQAGAFVEMNAHLARKVRLAYPMTLFLDVTNLLDGDGGLAASPVYTPATVPIEGRRVMFGADVRF